MKSLPIRRTQFKTGLFAAWLASEGAEIGTPTNPYEVIRYRAYADGSGKAATHIVYAKETGLLTWTGSSQAHYTQFMLGAQMYPAAVAKVAREAVAKPGKAPKETGGDKTRRKLLERDGDACWFCGLALGDDCTIEHLVAKSDGGFNRIANLALAHAVCNRDAGNLPLVKKIELRAAMRAGTKEPSHA